MGTSQDRSSVVDKCLAQRGEAFGIEWEQADGEDVYQVRAVTQTALERAHNESRPTVIEFDTYRYYGHSVADAKHKGGYRKEEEIEKYKNEHDPIRIFKNRLIAEKVINEEQYEAIDATLKAEANAAAQFAEKRSRRRSKASSKTFTMRSTRKPKQAGPEDFFQRLSLPARAHPLKSQHLFESWLSSNIATLSIRPLQRKSNAIPTSSSSARRSRSMMALQGDPRALEAIWRQARGGHPDQRGGIHRHGSGSSMLGLRPVIELMFWSFATVAYDQIVNNAGQIRYMSGG